MHSHPRLTTTTPRPAPTPALPSSWLPRTLSAYTHATQTTVHASQSQQPPHPHSVPRQPHRQTKDDHMTTDTTQAHIPRSKSEIYLIILQININGIKDKLEKLKLLIHDTHADIITIQETKLSLKQKLPMYITSLPCALIGFKMQGVDLLHSLETTLHSLQQTYLRPLIHTTQVFRWSRYRLAILKIMTIANIYIPPRDSISPHYKTADTAIQHCLQHITNIPHSVLTGDVKTHSTR